MTWVPKAVSTHSRQPSTSTALHAQDGSLHIIQESDLPQCMDTTIPSLTPWILARPISSTPGSVSSRDVSCSIRLAESQVVEANRWELIGVNEDLEIVEVD